MELALLVLSAVVFSAGACVEEEWSKFKIKYKKTYTSQNEEAYRFKVFDENLKKIQLSKERYDANISTYWLAVTEFADMTEEDYTTFLGGNLTSGKLYEDPYDALYDPKRIRCASHIDYREENATNVPRKQGTCGSCYAFATASVLESLYFLRFRDMLPILSPQNIVDCTPKYGNQGCVGGWPARAFRYVKDNGIYLEEDYRYQDKSSHCRSDGSLNFLRVGKIWKVYANEAVMQDALTNIGPVTALVDASEWHLYGGGIFRSSKPFRGYLHAVTIDGYGRDNGIDYWLIKNSHGTQYGEGGYIRIPRYSNEFGITGNVYFAEPL